MAKTCAQGSIRLYATSATFSSVCIRHHLLLQPRASSLPGTRTRGPQTLAKRPLHRGFAATAAAGGDGSTASLVDRLKSDMKEAMKAKDQARLDAIRFLNAAIKQREIELREGGGPMNDQEVIKVIQKLVKQRKDSIESYRAGGREDLVAKEQSELSLLEGYLPAMMSAAEVEVVVEAVVGELGGVSGPRAIGAVMKAVMARTGGRADNKTVSDLVKAKLK
ncbi:hypothetical protein VOLCADRAFT_96509 [Volvox carteri f. nagariensis]|uniref:GatB/YqeY domain-containing protein n=1 Tax=Volvox carteri f. nagariensis TaxID=3068 RepID=D8UAA8_VOLCA|nr:uncharacterized protein VOLCADRAFT_96509 [Volvox carteri f. nagariensis]EFJ43285.1 hypothetical protein VOLCADRAFT_96509 [Volvox carteri f. nagariensis]|eukprot:XP_002955645.1 hypothetical protein VOLCADRAFT_96509 [Volvox carteri f. nagariensis]